MTSRRSLILSGAAALATPYLLAPAEAAQNDQALIDRATATLEDLNHDQSFGNSGELIRTAKAVMVVPQLIKGGFIFGAEGGNGVMMTHMPDGWSNPAFYGIGAGSFGLQVGLQAAELVMFVMTSRGLDAWMRNEVKLGVDAGITVLVVGSAAEAATTNGKVDVVAWARSKGAYIGISLSGSVIKPDKKANARYYGKPLSAHEIMMDDRGRPRGDVQALRHALRVAAR
jgi:lipid-binding SYLF domain-containing protein